MHRAFFKKEIGNSFSFNVLFQQWLKANAGKTYADAVDAYYEIQKKKKTEKTSIGRQFEYNTYIRDFFADNNGKTLDDAIRCWKYKKSLKGPNHYERSDLTVLEEKRGMGILICGLNGTGKSTLGRMLADRMGFEFIDNEDLFFPKTDPSYMFSSPRSEEEAIRLLEEKIGVNNRFIFAAVKGNYGDKLIASLDYVVLIDAPKQIRSQRVRDRSYQKFGDRILPGGDLYDKESKWFSLIDSRPENYVADWLETVDCQVIRIDGMLPVEQNVDYLVSLLSKEIG